MITKENTEEIGKMVNKTEMENCLKMRNLYTKVTLKMEFRLKKRLNK